MTAAGYRTILFDLDHTLFDSDASEATALGEVLRNAGVAEPDLHRDTYDRINRALWAAVELQQVSPLHVRTARFEQLVEQAGLAADPFVMADEFVAGLARHGELYPGVREVLDTLARRATLALVTNGLSEVQRGRLERLGLVDHFAAVVISAEVGVAKPSPAIFDLTFEALGAPAEGDHADGGRQPHVRHRRRSWRRDRHLLVQPEAPCPGGGRSVRPRDRLDRRAAGARRVGGRRPGAMSPADEGRPSPMATILQQVVLGESPRWHGGRLWFCDWGARELVALDPAGRADVVPTAPSVPWSIDWLPDGRLVFTAARERTLVVQAADGSQQRYADLSHLSDYGWNELVVDGRGNAYTNNIDFDMLGGESPRPGIVAVVTPDGAARVVADGVEFPNGMVVTPDDSTLIVAESHGGRLTAFDIGDDGELSNRRVWADLGDGAPDGICLDAEGAIWYADVPNRRCVRVHEGGEVLQTVDLDRGCFACMLGGDAGDTLFVMAADWRGPTSMDDGRTGIVVAVPAPAPAAGRP